MNRREALELVDQLRTVLQNVSDERVKNPIKVMLRQKLSAVQLAELENRNEPSDGLLEVMLGLPEGELSVLREQLTDAFRVGVSEGLGVLQAQLGQTIGLPAKTLLSVSVVTLLAKWTYVTAPDSEAGETMRDFAFFLALFNFGAAAQRIFFGATKPLHYKVSDHVMQCAGKSMKVAAAALLPLAWFYSSLEKASSTLANGYLFLTMAAAFCATALYTLSESYALAFSPQRQAPGAGGR